MTFFPSCSLFCKRRNSSQVPFCKMQALGNDFVILDARNRSDALPDSLLDSLAIKRTAERRHGIGCDQLLVLTKPTHTEDAFDMTIFNPDASQAQACGNGTRCVARYVFDHDKNFRGKRKLSLWVAGQRLRVERLSQRLIAVEMGVPKFSAKSLKNSRKNSLGLTKPCRTESLPLAFDAKGYNKAFGVSMGNPHAVFFCDKSDTQIKQDLLRHGASLEKHPLFRFGANISFARCEKKGGEKKGGEKASNEVRLFVWERGAGNTRACGSAACATLVAGVRLGLLQREAVVRLEGGDLRLAWQSDSAPVVMTGPADYVFFGTTHLLT